MSMSKFYTKCTRYLCAITVYRTIALIADELKFKDLFCYFSPLSSTLARLSHTACFYIIATLFYRYGPYNNW